MNWTVSKLKPVPNAEVAETLVEKMVAYMIAIEICFGTLIQEMHVGTWVQICFFKQRPPPLPPILNSANQIAFL